MNDLDPKAQALLDSVRGLDGPTFREKARVKRRVLARAAGLMLAASAGASSSTAAASVWTAKAVVVVAVAASALVAGAVWGVATFRGHAHPGVMAAASPASPLGARLPSPPLAAPVAEPLQAPGTNEGTASTAGAGPRAAPPPVASPPTAVARPQGANRETLEQELPLLQGAQEALRSGDADRALSLLDAHARRFPDGALAEERKALHARALCRKTGDPLRARRGRGVLA